jgi:hypothetical protein
VPAVIIVARTTLYMACTSSPVGFITSVTLETEVPHEEFSYEEFWVISAVP